MNQMSRKAAKCCSRPHSSRAGSMIVAALLGVVLLLVCGLPALAQPETDSGDEGGNEHPLAVPLRALTEAISDSLANARRFNDQPPYFLVEKIRLKLRITQTVSGTGTVEVKVPVLPLSANVDAGVTVAATDELDMDLRPAPQTLVGAAEQIDLTALMAAIKSALPAQAGSDGQAGSGGLTAIGFTYSTEFYLQAKAEGGINLMIVKAGAEEVKTVTQRIEFKMCQTVDMVDCVE